MLKYVGGANQGFYDQIRDQKLSKKISESAAKMKSMMAKYCQRSTGVRDLCVKIERLPAVFVVPIMVDKQVLSFKKIVTLLKISQNKAL